MTQIISVTHCKKLDIKTTITLLEKDVNVQFSKVSKIFSLSKTAAIYLDNYSTLSKQLDDISNRSIKLSHDFAVLENAFYRCESDLNDLQINIYHECNGDLNEMLKTLSNIIKKQEIHDKEIDKLYSQLTNQNNHTYKSIEDKKQGILRLSQMIHVYLQKQMNAAKKNADKWKHKMDMSAISFIIPWVGAGVYGGFRIKYEAEQKKYNRAKESVNEITAICRSS